MNIREFNLQMASELYVILDGESLKLPRKEDPNRFLAGVVGLLDSLNIRGRLKVEGVVGRFTEERFPERRKRELEARGVHFTSMDSDDKEAADVEILRRINAWSLRCKRGVLILMTSDGGYGPKLQELRKLPNILACIVIYIPTTLRGRTRDYPKEVLHTWKSVLYGDTCARVAYLQPRVGRPVIIGINGIVWAGQFENWLCEDNPESITNRYEMLVTEFPASSAYWIEYAKHLFRIRQIEDVMTVYQRAAATVPYSVDFWLQYCTFAVNMYGVKDSNKRGLFEMALTYVGDHFRSSLLWDKYIQYEFKRQDWSRLAIIYTRVLKNPIQFLESYLIHFKALARKQPLSNLWSAEESEAAAAAGALSTDPKELKKYIDIREATYLEANEFKSRIIRYENGLWRPYFHLRPLNEPELANWHDYLNFVESTGDISKVYKLYERCVVACANYPEYWIRFVLSMKASGWECFAADAFDRAIRIYVKDEPDIYFLDAQLKEQTGDIQGARAAYNFVYTQFCGLLEAKAKHAEMEERQGNLDVAHSINKHVIKMLKEKHPEVFLPRNQRTRSETFNSTCARLNQQAYYNRNY